MAEEQVTFGKTAKFKFWLGDEVWVAVYEGLDDDQQLRYVALGPVPIWQVIVGPSGTEFFMDKYAFWAGAIFTTKPEAAAHARALNKQRGYDNG